eukprot:9501251-Pyramimonas_sp.AAC.1
MQSARRRAADVARHRCAPQSSQNTAATKAFDMNWKPTFEFSSASAASGFPSDFQNMEGRL